MPALFFVLILAAISGYWPALYGPFVLDDLPNFYGLRFVKNLPSTLDYALHGEAGTRYLSYLVFALHADSFSANQAFPFKFSSLLLHGINTLLAFLLVYQLLKHKALAPNPAITALATASLWFVHPIHTGTVLYSVQFMNVLAGFFVLAGCLLHLYVVRFYQERNDRGYCAWLIYTGILWAITLLAIFSKENGILLLALVALINHWLGIYPFKTWQRAITLYAPLLALALLLIIDQRLEFGGRGFSMAERLMSQVVILQEYALKIIFPTDTSFSLFYDDFSIVHSPLEPRFLLAGLFWFCLLFIGHQFDRLAPGFLFGILWFLTGHLLESTIIPLELYFDHRNYLPALGLVFSAVILTRHFVAAGRKAWQRIAAAALAGVLVINATLVLQQETGFWENEQRLATSLYLKHPQSLRAHQFLAEAQFRAGAWGKSLETVEKIHRDFGPKPSSVIHQISLACMTRPDSIFYIDRLREDIATMPYDTNVTAAMEGLYALVKSRQCPALDWAAFRTLAQALIDHSGDAKQTYNMTYLLQLSYQQEQRPDLALATSLTLPKALLSVKFRLIQIDLAIKSHDKKLAKTLYDDLLALPPGEKVFYTKELEQLDLFMKEYLNEQ